MSTCSPQTLSFLRIFYWDFVSYASFLSVASSPPNFSQNELRCLIRKTEVLSVLGSLWGPIVCPWLPPPPWPSLVNSPVLPLLSLTSVIDISTLQTRAPYWASSNFAKAPLFPYIQYLMSSHGGNFVTIVQINCRHKYTALSSPESITCYSIVNYFICVHHAVCVITTRKCNVNFIDSLGLRSSRWHVTIFYTVSTQYWDGSAVPQHLLLQCRGIHSRYFLLELINTC